VLKFIIAPALKRIGKMELAKITLELVKKARGGSTGMWLVKDSDGNILGLLEKYNDTRTDKHPWKAFLGHGASVKYLGAFYPELGGKTAAIRCIRLAHRDACETAS
jgi:hypothetical protein